jgi:hypothetical protein
MTDHQFETSDRVRINIPDETGPNYDHPKSSATSDGSQSRATIIDLQDLIDG